MAVTAGSIITPQAPKANTAEVTTANTNYDTPANTAVLITAGANGARATRISVIPRETIADTQIQLYRDGDGSGTNKRFFKSVKAPSYTMATGTEAAATDFGYSDDNPLILGIGEKVYIATAITKKFTGNAEWADY